MELLLQEEEYLHRGSVGRKRKRNAVRAIVSKKDESARRKRERNAVRAIVSKINSLLSFEVARGY